MANFEFTKMHGTGNDFIVVDNRTEKGFEWTPDFVAQICDRRLGIGADGLLLLEASDEAAFRMRYFNSDGSEAEMCGNGSRCISWFAYQQLDLEKQFAFQAMDGIHRVKITGENRVRVQMKVAGQTDPRSFPAEMKLPDGSRFLNFINTGVPHLVLYWPRAGTNTIAKSGSKLRFHSYYQPQGTNVNFCEIITAGAQSVLKVRTFERGVDEETLSCGSGVTASALTFNKMGLIDGNTIPVRTLGGDLRVTIGEDADEIFLEGPVKVSFRGIYQS